eukprot:1089760-Pleurochrysis_carterae.AAC.3
MARRARAPSISRPSPAHKALSPLCRPWASSSIASAAIASACSSAVIPLSRSAHDQCANPHDSPIAGE